MVNRDTQAGRTVWQTEKSTQLSLAKIVEPASNPQGHLPALVCY